MANNFFGLKCPDCGSRITEEDDYCPNCGVDLNAPLSQSFSSAEEALTARQYLEEAQRGYDDNHDLPRALHQCDLAIEQQPELAEAHNLRGLILDALGRPEEAILSYREATRLDPIFEDARANLEDAENERRINPPEAAGQEAKPGWNWTKIIVGIVISAFLLTLIAGAYFMFKIGLQYFGPKQLLVLEPDYSLITSNVKTEDLQQTALILTERAAHLGYPQVSFSVSNNGEFQAKVPYQVDLEDFFQRISSIGLVEFVDFGQTPVPVGTRVATDIDHKFLQQGEGVEYQTLMTNAEIRDVSIATDVFGKPAIAFTLTENGTELFFEYTSRNVGRYLGIVRDKVVISSPVVNTPIPDGAGMIQGSFSEQEANDLVAVLQTRPLPIPIRLKAPVGSG